VIRSNHGVLKRGTNAVTCLKRKKAIESKEEKKTVLRSHLDLKR
jgi:hypothetical protein